MRLTGTVFRAHHPRWSFAPASGTGAAIYGGRFNPVGMPALYTSLRMETAWMEAQQGFPLKAQPLTICAYDVDCDDVADLTRAQDRARFGIAAEDLRCAWKSLLAHGIVPPTWQLARRLVAAGIAAIIVPSFVRGARPDDRNVVFWDWSDQPPHRLQVIDDENRLPLKFISDAPKPGSAPIARCR